MTHSRRSFLGGLASAAAASVALRPAAAGAHAATGQTSPAAAPVARRGIKLGLDHFAIRGFNWKAPQLIDYAASQKLDAIFLSELNVLESRDDAYLKGLRAQAEKGGLTLYLGMSSICPTSGAFDAKAGTAVDQLQATASGWRRRWARR